MHRSVPSGQDERLARRGSRGFGKTLPLALALIALTLQAPQTRAEEAQGADSGPSLNESSPGADTPSGARVMTARLLGSMCPACLKHLAQKLQETKGVLAASVNRPFRSIERHGETVKRYEHYARVEIRFDDSATDAKQLEKLIRASDFRPTRISVKEAGGEPDAAAPSEKR